MPTVADGQYLNTYVAPQLLQEFRNYKDDFVGVIPGAPKGAVTADGLRANKLINNVDFVVNNNTDFTPAAMSGKKSIITWDRLDTTPTEATDEEVRYLAYDKRAEIRLKHAESWKIGFRDYILNKLAPSAAAGGFVFLRTTGADDGNGRKRLTYNDMIEFESQVNALNLPNADALYMILCAQHQNDLKLDLAGTNYNRNAIAIDPKTGSITRFYKLKCFENNAAPIYTSAGAKKALGSTIAAGDQFASTFFYAPNTVKYVDSIKILYKPEITDTRSASPTSEFRLQGYGLVDRTQDYGFGALISENAS